LCICTHTHIVDTTQTTKCLVYMYYCVFWAGGLYYYEINLKLEIQYNDIQTTSLIFKVFIHLMLVKLVVFH